MSADSTQSKTSFVADSLAIGMLVMLAMTVVQRALGFVRGIWFCRVLDDSVVGQWAMAYDFIVMIAPVMLFGLPGALPRYVEHFRLQGHLSELVRRTLIATIALGSVLFGLMLLFPAWFGWLVFLDSESTGLVYGAAGAVLAIIVFNFVSELVSSLRQVRVLSVMQFVQSVGFTVIGIAWLSLGGHLAGLINAFSAATLLAIVPGVLALNSGWQGLPRSHDSFDASAMWRRVLPFAIAIWSMNLLNNVFALSDRYMILHLMPAGGLDGQAAVGQYHSGRIFPVLLISVAGMVAGVLLPYLTADWEADRREAVRQRMKRILFGVSAIFSVGAAVVLLLAPWIFSELLENRYSAGLSLMPMAFVFSIWVSLETIGQNYLWVAERGKLAAWAMGIGLVANIALNFALLPIWGLHGAVLATTIANLVVLLGVWLGMSRVGYPLDRTAFYATILPATLLAGPWATLICVAVCCIANPQAKDWCIEGCEALGNRIRR